MNFSIPINFGTRPCDRLLILSLTGGDLSRDSVLWMMFLVWQDFATARQDLREVPTADEARSGCPAVRILEEYIKWPGASGEFVKKAIESKFFLLTPVSGDVMELVLADFFPANAKSTTLNNSERGGIAKAFAGVNRKAEAAAADQLNLFQRTGALEGVEANDRELRSAFKLVHSICLALHRQPPVDEAWKNTLIKKALDVTKATNQVDIDKVIRWFVKNRSDQTIPARVDLVLENFETFVPQARIVFGA